MDANGSDPLGFSTRCVHAGRRPSGADPGVAPPLVRSSTFAFDAAASHALAEGRDGEVWIYSRTRNPTVELVEARVAALEGAERCAAFASGMGALCGALFALLAPGGHLLADRALYGGTRALLDGLLSQLGLSVTYVDLEDAAAFQAALRPNSRAVLCESVTNPLVRVRDVPTLAARAHAHGLRLLVDATFASPLLQRPLELGADLVMHSASKYLGGHSDLIAGVLSGPREPVERARQWRRYGGACLDPDTAYLLERGIKTLPLRMRAAGEGATHLAAALDQTPGVRAVHHPTLPPHPDHGRWARLLAGPPAMLAFEVEGGDEAARAALQRLRVALDAPSLGGVETLCCLPAITSHAGQTAAEHAASGIVPGLVRVSVGVEDAVDLVRDFRQALAGR